MSVKIYENFKDENLERVITTAPPIGDTVRMGMRGPSDGFREVLSRIKERNPYSNLGNKLSRN